MTCYSDSSVCGHRALTVTGSTHIHSAVTQIDTAQDKLTAASNMLSNVTGTANYNITQ